ncbi:hypothetical protein CEXT_706831 [Caerostris extrusa]|uniref:Uncharacterized protein n=1 Tax=Caerostris extrusa TaxID=172846 RepID=A0AAV4PTE6_CAEEX|nr:hypothetical protein CEXT_706831 [Caerostris extrusa]
MCLPVHNTILPQKGKKKRKRRSSLPYQVKMSLQRRRLAQKQIPAHTRESDTRQTPGGPSHPRCVLSQHSRSPLDSTAAAQG